MVSNVCCARRMGIAAIVLAAGLTDAAVAQDAKLSVQVSPQILLPGQSAQVDVRAHVPTGMYAFAGALFDVDATDPAWTFASAGAIVGSDVLAIGAGQLHMPQVGVFADPTDPYHVWTGGFTPESYEPALVQITADPTMFSAYPSELTSSSAICDAEGGSDYVMVNPVAVGRWRAAPAKGTAIRVADDVVVDGKIITAENPASIMMALLLPAVQRSRESAVRVGLDGAAEYLGAEVQVGVADLPMESLAINFTKITYARTYEMHADFPLGVGLQIQFSLGGRRIGKLGASEGRLPILVERTPDIIIAGAGAGAGPHVRVFDGASGAALRGETWAPVTMTSRYDEPVRVEFANGQSLMVDQIDVHGRMQCQNNLKQIGLAVHTFEVAGVERMSLTPSQP